MGIDGPLLLLLADPFLTMELAELRAVQVIESGADTLADCCHDMQVHQPGAVLLSQAISPYGGAMTAFVTRLKKEYPQAAFAILGTAHPLFAADWQALQQMDVEWIQPGDSACKAVTAWLRTERSGSYWSPADAAGLGESMPPAGATSRLPQPGAPLSPLPQPVITPSIPTSALFHRSVQQPPSTPFSPPATPFTPPLATPPLLHGPGLTPLPPSSPTQWLPSQGTQGPVLRQKVVAVWSGKAGVGRSTLVTALADTLHRIPGIRVCMVDLHPANSSLAALVRKESSPNSWLAMSRSLWSGSLTARAVAEGLVPVETGWSLVTGPGGIPQWTGLLSTTFLAELLEHLRPDFDYILLDLPAGRSPWGDSALTFSQTILLLVSAFYPDLVDTARLYEQALADGLFASERCRLILSQWVDSAEMPAADISLCMKMPIAARLPLAPQAAMAAARAGRPVTQFNTAEAKPLADAAVAVAGLIAGGALSRPGRRGWFGK